MTVVQEVQVVGGGAEWMVIVDLALGQGVKPSRFVPSQSRWCIRIPVSYPLGPVRFVPAKDRGIQTTFPHQERNDAGDHDVPWRTGKICLDRATARLGSMMVGRAPESAEDKLTWHVQRALAWLDAAAKGQLLAPGEPFEVPQVKPSREIRVVHDESTASFEVWQARLGSWGHWGPLELEPLPGASKTILAGIFKDRSGVVIRRALRPPPSEGIEWKGFWWIWPKPIALPPWRAPSTWGELREVARCQGVDFNRTLRNIVASCSSLEAPLLLVGFPMPAVAGGEPVELHWQAISLPGKSVKPKIPNGFRNNLNGRWQALLRSTFGSSRSLPLILTVNWHPDRTQARGRLRPGLRERSVAVIGVGALGAAVAELLVRAGVQRALLIDGDTLEVGNLVRHSLGLGQLGQNKAVAVAERLRLVAPMAEVSASGAFLPQAPDEVCDLLGEVDIVIDCTAEDDVVKTLAASWWAPPKLFVSTSVGYKAERVFIFTAAGSCFPADTFFSEMAPWLSRERELWANDGETLEGAGCWSPLFPARLDDLWLAAVATVKRVESVMVERCFAPELEVLGLQVPSGRFQGLAPLEEPNEE
ncbi:MAG: ThiF family adenylyltransferase [Alphaproteobacteria bacterium]|nr:ThiF family adenylyltransferase [Alphaproteobacteria bacterium]